MRSNPFALAVFLGAGLLPVSLSNLTGNAQEQVLVTSNQLLPAEKSRDESEEEATLRRLVEQDYRALWTKKNGTFSIEPADRLYANSAQLTAIDTDLMAIQLTPNQSTRINGYENYRALWPRIFKRVGGFEQEIKNVQVRINGTWAITTFDGLGTYIALDGKQTRTHKNFTLVWERRPEGWRIIHEHISDGR